MKKALFVLLPIIMISCTFSTKEEKKDAFDFDNGSFDYGRFPLIKPFEVGTAYGDNWVLSARNDDSHRFTVEGVDSVKVVSDFILAHALKTTVNSAYANEGWFVIIPKTHFFQGMAKHQQYLDLLHKLGFVREPALDAPNDVFRYFVDHHYTIDWN